MTTPVRLRRSPSRGLRQRPGQAGSAAPARYGVPLMHLNELIERSSARLEQAGVSFGHGTSNARDEAAWLVLWSLGLPLDADLGEIGGREITRADQARVNALVEERISTRQPAPYLTQEAWLQGVPFYVDERSIVPRSFIAELLADGSIDPWLSDRTERVLDLCTGNGSLAVLAAMAYPEVRVDASDISDDALDVARINVDKHHLGERIHLLRSDGLSKTEGPYDLIICNPPYVNTQSMRELPQEYQNEPALALAGGEDGMDFIRPLLRDAQRHMSEHAVLVLEIGNERAHFEAAFPRLEVVWLMTSAGEDQVLLVTRESLSKHAA